MCCLRRTRWAFPFFVHLAVHRFFCLPCRILCGKSAESPPVEPSLISESDSRFTQFFVSLALGPALEHNLNRAGRWAGRMPTRWSPAPRRAIISISFSRFCRSSQSLWARFSSLVWSFFFFSVRDREVIPHPATAMTVDNSSH